MSGLNNSVTNTTQMGGPNSQMSSTTNSNLPSGAHPIGSNNMPPGVSVPPGGGPMPPMYNGHPNGAGGMMNNEVAMRMRQQSKYRMGNPTGGLRQAGIPGSAPGSTNPSGPGGPSTVRPGQQSPMGGMSPQQMMANQGMRQQVCFIIYRVLITID